jgi:multidrug efflux pump subunit AcrA (membrane-fusion protein)
MNWLREHMRDHVTSAASVVDSRENVLNVPGDPPAPSRDDASAAPDIVSQAAEVIKGIQDHAVESESRARALAESAIEKLQLAAARVQSAEAARSAAEETLSKQRARLQEAERELTRTQSRNAAAEMQLANAEQRMAAAETRAASAEKAVNQIENAIRTQLVGLQKNSDYRIGARGLNELDLQVGAWSEPDSDRQGLKLARIGRLGDIACGI